MSAVAIIGGSKVSMKLDLLNILLERVDALIVGGGIANTFLVSTGKNVGASLYEPDFVEASKDILAKAKKLGRAMPLPVDVVVTEKLAPGQTALVCDVDRVPSDKMILDVGPKTVAVYNNLLVNSATVVWNGPVGAFETEPFGAGTKAIAETLAEQEDKTFVGGGDSVSAVEGYGLASKRGFLSTGGGVFFELLEGKQSPVLVALKK